MLTYLRVAGSLVLMIGAVLWLAGCGGKQAATDSASTSESSSDDHEHHEGDGHDHGEEGHDHEEHAHGPHDGELIELAGAAPGESAHAEWTHDEDSSRVTVFILDEAQKEERPIEAASVTIEVAVKGKEPESYSLEAVSPDADGKASQFEIEDPQLLVALKLKEAVDAQLQVAIDGKNLTGKVEFKEHGHHH